MGNPIKDRLSWQRPQLGVAGHRTREVAGLGELHRPSSSIHGSQNGLWYTCLFCHFGGVQTRRGFLGSAATPLSGSVLVLGRQVGFLEDCHGKETVLI